MVRMQGKPQYTNDASKSKFKQRHYILLYLLYNTVIFIFLSEKKYVKSNIKQNSFFLKQIFESVFLPFS